MLETEEKYLEVVRFLDYVMSKTDKWNGNLPEEWWDTLEEFEEYAEKLKAKT